MLRQIQYLIILVALIVSCNVMAEFINFPKMRLNQHIMVLIRTTGKKYISPVNTANNSKEPLSILWVEKGFGREKAKKLQKKIDEAIPKIEAILQIPYNGRNFTITYYVYSANEPCHEITGYTPVDKMYPIVFLSKERAYLHETVHIIAWHWRSVWMKEGLAVYLNDKLNGDPMFPNFGMNLENLAKQNLSKLSTVPFPLDGIVHFTGIKQKKLFYIFAGSFVGYIFQKVGAKKFMEIYNADNTEQKLKKVTNHDIEYWKSSWKEYLTSKAFNENLM